MSARWFSYPDARSAAEACAHNILARLEDALSGRSYATLALSGGLTPRPLFEFLARADFPWRQVHLFWVDERAVPPTHPASNYRVAAECFILPARIPSRNVHRICGELMPDIAARRYVEEIRAFFGLEPGELPHFDVIHRGVGPDGHTASLFPCTPEAVNETSRLVVAHHVPVLGRKRMSVTIPLINAARNVILLVTGDDKADAVARLLGSDEQARRDLPAARISPTDGRLFVVLDAAAARLL